MELGGSPEPCNENNKIKKPNDGNTVDSDLVLNQNSEKQDDSSLDKYCDDDVNACPENQNKFDSSKSKNKCVDVSESATRTETVNDEDEKSGTGSIVSSTAADPQSFDLAINIDQNLDSDTDQLKKVPIIALPSIFTSPLKSFKNLTKRTTAESVSTATPMTGNLPVVLVFHLFYLVISTCQLFCQCISTRRR